MSVLINASTSAGIQISGDLSGNTQFQTSGSNTLFIGTNGLLNAYYNGVQPGLVPGMQYYLFQSPVNLTGNNATGPQSVFNRAVSLQSNTTYAFEGLYILLKSAGTTSHTINTSFPGTSTLNNIYYLVLEGDSSGQYNALATTVKSIVRNTADGTVATTGALTAASQYASFYIKGVVVVNAAGTFVPTYNLSAAPGGAYNTANGSYFAIWPVSVGSSSNVSIGSWA